MNRTVLITGFEPFTENAVNPSAEIARRLEDREITGRRVVTRILPVEFERAGRELAQALRSSDPELVICLGLAANRAAISFERIAINLDDARVPDNAGNQPVDRPIIVRGPAACWSTLPVKAMRAAVQAAGYPAELSQSAGTFVCNHVFYRLMRLLARRSGCRGGFVHVPPERAGFDVGAMAAAIEIAVATALAHPRDIAVPGGTVS